ncbi:MAG: hypothetical protein JF604_16505 [Bradyrhizobium sp.]|nr:hypothetical protein [Bradyrhizobium sp.]
MRFFLCEIVARIVAVYLCVDCMRMLRDGYAERKIRAFSPDLVVWLLDWSRQVFQRDTAPAYRRAASTFEGADCKAARLSTRA